MFALIILTLSTDLSHLHDWKHCAKCVLKNCPFHQRKMKGKRNVAAKSPKWRFPWWYTQILQAIWKEMWTYRWASIRERFLKETNKHNFKNHICKRFKWNWKKKPFCFLLKQLLWNPPMLQKKTNKSIYLFMKLKFLSSKCYKLLTTFHWRKIRTWNVSSVT